MRGADASAGTIKSGGKTRRAAKMVVLDVDHPDVEEFIWCKAKEEEKARVLEQAGYDMSLDSPDWASIQYQNANNSVRVTDAFMEAAEAGAEWNLTARTDGTVVDTVDARGLLRQIAEAAWQCADPGVQYDTTINAWHTCPNSGRINASNPCSEYMHLDDSACNLASLNLMKFRREDGELDVEAFEHAVDVVFLAQEIVVGYSSYPTPEIEREREGLPRARPRLREPRRAADGARPAVRLRRGPRVRGGDHGADDRPRLPQVGRDRRPDGPVRRLPAERGGDARRDREAPRGGRQHRALRLGAGRPALGGAQAWDDALDLGEVHGFRNAQATVLAPTGTISFMMDCDTTGVEPDFSLVKSKKLVGGGEITIVNKTVPMALDKLGYAPSEVEEIVAFIDERNTIVGAPYVKAEHYPVFDCAIGDRAIHYSGHVKMMGAVQPFISGAISKTVNLPEQATVDEVAQLIVDAWRLGVKAIAIYRDNCKVAQPLSGKGGRGGQRRRRVPPTPLTQRRRLPEDRTEVGRKFRVGDYEGYIHVGLYEDGTPGDIFVDIAKDGTTMAGLMNSLMIAVSMGLQYGVPPEVYVSKLSHMRFEPSGLTNDADIRTREVDRRLHLPLDRQEVPHARPAGGGRDPLAGGEGAAGGALRERRRRAPAAPVESPPPGQTALFNSWEDAVECAKCGGRMVRTGSCYTCRDCGTNTGCS